jgi:hypothetical protein
MMTLWLTAKEVRREGNIGLAEQLKAAGNRLRYASKSWSEIQVLTTPCPRPGFRDPAVAGRRMPFSDNLMASLAKLMALQQREPINAKSFEVAMAEFGC